jgi:hypothetical protein
VVEKPLGKRIITEANETESEVRWLDLDYRFMDFVSQQTCVLNIRLWGRKEQLKILGNEGVESILPEAVEKATSEVSSSSSLELNSSRKGFTKS